MFHPNASLMAEWALKFSYRYISLSLLAETKQSVTESTQEHADHEADYKGPAHGHRFVLRLLAHSKISGEIGAKSATRRAEHGPAAAITARRAAIIKASISLAGEWSWTSTRDTGDAPPSLYPAPSIPRTCVDSADDRDKR